MKKLLALLIVFVLSGCVTNGYQYNRQSQQRTDNIGVLSNNPFDSLLTGNPLGQGNEYRPNSVKNPIGIYGSPYSPKSATNPYATNAPKLYDQSGNYRGRLSTNPYDPESISNPIGVYGSPFGSNSLMAPDSLKNPFGRGLIIMGQ